MRKVPVLKYDTVKVDGVEYTHTIARLAYEEVPENSFEAAAASINALGRALAKALGRFNERSVN